MFEEMTGGRGPDACIDAVGMEGHAPGIAGAYDRAKQAMMLGGGRVHEGGLEALTGFSA